MKKVKNFVRVAIVIAVLVGAGVFIIAKYSWVFSKTVEGKILDVQRVTESNAIFSARVTEQQIHSYAVLIQGNDGVLYTASSEDRQWQVAAKGFCVRAKLYRYPPWDLQHANQFFNARLEELRLCPGETEPPPPSPPQSPNLKEPGKESGELPPPESHSPSESAH